MRRYVLLLLSMIGFGLTPAARAQDQNAALLACVQAAYNSPAAAPIRPHLPLNPLQATLAQIADTSLATKAEIAALLAIHPQYKACQQQALAAMARILPAAVSVLERTYADGDDDTALLVQRRISWGERVRRWRDRTLAARSEIVALAQAARQQGAIAAQDQRAAEAARQAEANRKLGCMNNALLNSGALDYTAPFQSGRVPAGSAAAMAGIGSCN